MAKEDIYREQLEALGLWTPAVAYTVHDLCILERELNRTRARWKKTADPGEAPSTLHPLYNVIRKQTQEIMSMRDALGLTPKSLRRIKGAPTEEPKDNANAGTVLQLVLDKFGT